MRGFHVDKLNYDPEDAKFDDPKARHLPAEQERADHVLTNGGRLYNDHGHPEFGTPECAGLLDLVTYDRAGEQIVLDCARRRMEQGAGEVRIYKNNTDYHGSSYGTHESYLMRRERPFGEVLSNFLPFFCQPDFVRRGREGRQRRQGRQRAVPALAAGGLFHGRSVGGYAAPTPDL